MPDYEKLNLGGGSMTPHVLALIATMLERHGSLLITNGQIMGFEGAAAFSLGQVLTEELLRREMGKYA